MGPLVDFSASLLPVRDDIVRAHRTWWERLAGPGTWWTGRERVAIAAESRAARGCALCAARRQAVSPNAVQGEHDVCDLDAATLSAPAVEAIHRITTDASRLGRRFVEQLEADGLSDAHYVELLGIVSSLASIDACCRGLGVPLHALPEPRDGEPSRVRPAAARLDVAWVPMLPPDGARGSESDLWGPRTGNVIRALSLVPDAVRDLQLLSAAHYVDERGFTDLAGGRALSRSQMELLAARVSVLNECFY